jgi:hypothetical protein
MKNTRRRRQKARRNRNRTYSASEASLSDPPLASKAHKKYKPRASIYGNHWNESIISRTAIFLKLLTIAKDLSHLHLRTESKILLDHIKDLLLR